MVGQMFAVLNIPVSQAVSWNIYTSSFRGLEIVSVLHAYEHHPVCIQNDIKVQWLRVFYSHNLKWRTKHSTLLCKSVTTSHKQHKILTCVNVDTVISLTPNIER